VPNLINGQRGFFRRFFGFLKIKFPEKRRTVSFYPSLFWDFQKINFQKSDGLRRPLEIKKNEN